MCERKGGGERVQLQVLSVVSLLSKKKKKEENLTSQNCLLDARGNATEVVLKNHK